MLNGSKTNLIVERTYQFALEIIRLNQRLVEQREFVISRQLLRSGTSIGANVEEAQAAQSKADFSYKMSIAAKEARETHYWLRLMKDAGQIDAIAANAMIIEIEQIKKILTSIVKTTSEAR